MNPRKKIRALVAKHGYTIVPGAYDTLTARLVQLAGFDAVYLTGGGGCAARFGPGHHRALGCARRRGIAGGDCRGEKVLAVLKRDGDAVAIESELATFSDREEAVNSGHWRELETRYLKNV